VPLVTERLNIIYWQRLESTSDQSDKSEKNKSEKNPRKVVYVGVNCEHLW